MKENTDPENKFDEDFLFYLGFVTTFIDRIRDQAEKQKLQGWLKKLVGETCDGADKKRNRNIFLSNLVLCMEEGKIMDPFNTPPTDVDFSNPAKYFPALAKDIQTPEWVDDAINRDPPEENEGRDSGRTYVATRSMPNGDGAFAYVAISMADDEPKWLGGGEGLLDEKLEQKYNQIVPPPTELDILMAKRRDPKERQRVLTFYDVLLQNITDELDNVVPMEENDAINVLVNQLTDDMRSKGEFHHFQEIENEVERRVQLLLILHDRTKKRRDRIAKREEMLDNIEAMMVPNKSFFEDSMLEEDRYEMPGHMWENVINKPPAKKLIEQMDIKYPYFVVKTFIRLLSDEKEEIAMRMQRRHENMASQLRKELRKEGQILKDDMIEVKNACEEAMAALKNVRAARQKQIDSENAIPKRKKGGETAMTQLYEEMREALEDTQHSVEDEAEKGKLLSKEINTLNEQTEVYHQVTEESVLKSEEANIAIMKNIKRLRAAMTQHENRLAQIQLMAQKKANSSQPQDSFYVF